MIGEQGICKACRGFFIVSADSIITEAKTEFKVASGPDGDNSPLVIDNTPTSAKLLRVIAWVELFCSLILSMISLAQENQLLKELGISMTAFWFVSGIVTWAILVGFADIITDLRLLRIKHLEK
ncbi:MAG: hypothetical protein SGI97_07525 [candidate division Zixibacteria bacterium]|nr:hypothetical protein [candidate division Zixibacteria bacterium]